MPEQLFLRLKAISTLSSIMSFLDAGTAFPATERARFSAQSIVALPDTGSTWFDLGTPERIRKAEVKIKPATH